MGRIPDQDLSTIISALRIAEDVYRKDAATMHVQHQPRIAEQFDLQARECLKLRLRLEDDE